MTTKYCHRNKFGYCNKGYYCRYRHALETCERENCTKFNCNLRHPVECSFFNQFQRCKFLNCAYKHVEKVSIKEFNKIREKVIKLEEMLETRNNDKCFSCEKCNQTVKSENDLQNHMRNHHLEDEFNNLHLEVLNLKDRIKEMTHKLGELEPSKDALKSSQNHPIVKNKELTLKCEKCQYETKDISLLNEHMQEKHRIYKCELCNFTSSCDIGLKIHSTQIHSQLHHPIVQQSRETVCDLCNQDFKFKKKIWVHMTKIHFINTKFTVTLGHLVCMLCGKDSSTYTKHANYLT